MKRASDNTGRRNEQWMRSSSFVCKKIVIRLTFSEICRNTSVICTRSCVAAAKLGSCVSLLNVMDSL